jgi:antitoxin HicB
MANLLKPIPLVFWRSTAGLEPAREWLDELPPGDQRSIGRDIAEVQLDRASGLPMCRSLGDDLWEARLSLATRRKAGVLFGLHDGVLIALHAFIRETKATAADDLALARQRFKEAKTNPHLGSTFESWLDEAGVREEAIAAAVKSMIAALIAEEMEKRNISKVRMAELMQTSRAQVDRLLDPTNGSATLETLMRAARVIGRELRLELV